MPGSQLCYLLVPSPKVPSSPAPISQTPCFLTPLRRSPCTPGLLYSCRVGLLAHVGDGSSGLVLGPRGGCQCLVTTFSGSCLEGKPWVSLTDAEPGVPAKHHHHRRGCH
jgi:hypothetical protein